MPELEWKKKKVGFIELPIGTAGIKIYLHTKGKKNILFINDDTTNYLTVNFDGIVIAKTGTDGSKTALSAVFTSAGSTFITDGVQPGDLLRIYEGDADDGIYEIVSVDKETQLTISKALTLTLSSVDFQIMSPKILAGESKGYVTFATEVQIKASADTVSTRIFIQYHAEV